MRKKINIFTFCSPLRLLYQFSKLLGIKKCIMTFNKYNQYNNDSIQIDKFQKLQNNIENTHEIWLKHIRMIENNEKIQISQKLDQSQNDKKRFFSFFKNNFSTCTEKDINVKGIYLYGSSGCGKSFLCDIFYNQLKIKEKKRIHFHQFMNNIHTTLFQLEKSNKGYDPLASVASQWASKNRLLYLDQFQVTDVADASILKRLFKNLFANKLILLATSNRHPNQLYKKGHQRQFFLPFIQFLQQHCEVHHLNSHKDYRYDMQQDNTETKMSYFSPIDEVSNTKLNEIFRLLSNDAQIKPVILEPIQGRKLVIQNAAGLVCQFQFNQLVDKVMGDSDFRVICKHFKAIFITNMHRIESHERNIANRLIKLFDQAYFRKVKIYISGTVGLQDIICTLSEKDSVTQEDFAMIRCKSRLIQFQTKQYKEKLSQVENNLVQDDEQC